MVETSREAKSAGVDSGVKVEVVREWVELERGEKMMRRNLDCDFES